MKALPVEGAAPSKKQSGSKRHSGRGTSGVNPRLVHYAVAVKKISRRLDQYADHDLGEREILNLLEDTRSRVISLHIARKQLKNQNPRRKHRRSGHSTN